VILQGLMYLFKFIMARITFFVVNRFIKFIAEKIYLIEILFVYYLYSNFDINA